MQLTARSVNRSRGTHSVFRGKAVFLAIVSGIGGAMLTVPVFLRLLGLFLVVDSHDVSACSQSTAPAVVEMRITQPLIATGDGDLALKVGVRVDGCVTIHYPSYDTRAGDYAYQLSAAELRSLQAEIDTSGIAKFDPASVRRDLLAREVAKRARPEGHARFAVSDEEVIEFRMGPHSDVKGRASTLLVWSRLREQLLNHPDQAALIGLAAVRDRLLELGSDRLMTKIER